MATQVEILYCHVWNYKPRAASLAAIIKKEFGIETKLTAGKVGQFDVLADGRLIFSKHKENRFPEEDEIIEDLR